MDRYLLAVQDIINTEHAKRLERDDWHSDEAHAECNSRITERRSKMTAWLNKTGRLPKEVVIREKGEWGIL